MKISCIFALLLLGAFTPAIAGIPASYQDIVKLYGKPDAVGWIGGKQTFHYDDMTIYVVSDSDSDTVASIEFDRETPFNELEIGGILKPLSVEEDWQQAGRDWILKDAKVKAHWNGQGKIVVKGS